MSLWPKTAVAKLFACVILVATAAISLFPQIVGHKVWLIAWAYESIFHPPAYDATAVTQVARMRLTGWWEGVPGFRVLECRDFGEEAREFLVEYVDEEGAPVKRVVRVWVRWKPWTMNNGEGDSVRSTLESTESHELD